MHADHAAILTGEVHGQHRSWSWNPIKLAIKPQHVRVVRHLTIANNWAPTQLKEIIQAEILKVMESCIKGNQKTGMLLSKVITDVEFTESSGVHTIICDEMNTNGRN